MKKVLSLLAAGSVLLSTAAVSFAAETSSSSSSATSTSSSVSSRPDMNDCTWLRGVQRSRCELKKKNLNIENRKYEHDDAVMNRGQMKQMMKGDDGTVLQKGRTLIFKRVSKREVNNTGRMQMREKKVLIVPYKSLTKPSSSSVSSTSSSTSSAASSVSSTSSSVSSTSSSSSSVSSGN